MYRYIFFVILSLLPFSYASAFELDLEASTTVNAGTGPFAPSLIMANRAGAVTQAVGIYERVSLFHRLDENKKFSYSFGVDGFVEDVSTVDYERWNDKESQFEFIARRPASATLQQLYGEIKYRSLFLFLGMKEHDRTFLDNPLSSGDLTISNNARPIPQLRVGFYDFVNIPLTRGWVQIIGDIAYGKFTDSKWNKDHYNYYNHFLTTDVWFHYKRLYLRSNPNKRFVATVGMQHASQFWGEVKDYDKGVCTYVYKPKHFFKSIVDVFFQTQFNDSEINGESLNFVGNHLGSWDVKFEYKLGNNDQVSFYVMKPWEDGTGIGWQNGFDGVWGIAYKSNNNFAIKGATLEYLDFTNQAGPFLHEPSESLPTNTTGGDDYYNNFMYNGWTNYGMGVGSPVLKSTIYNTDGFLRYLDNAVRGFHLGIDGKVGKVDLRMLLSWKQAKGTQYMPRSKKVQSTSMMLGADYCFSKVEGLSFKAEVGFDAGDLYPACFGTLFTLSYKGSFNIKRRVK